MSSCEWCGRPATVGLDLCCYRCDEEAGAHTPECDAARAQLNRSTGEERGSV